MTLHATAQRRIRARATGRIVSVVVLWLTTVGVCSTAHAHGFNPGLLVLEESPGGRVAVVWKLPLGGEAGSEGRDPMSPHFPQHCRVTATRTMSSVPLAALERFTLDCGPRGLGGARIAVDGLERSGADVVVRVRFSTGRRATFVLRASAPSITLPSSATGTRWAVARTYAALGIEHILRGADHLMFVFGLLLLVRKLGALVRTITAFTIGHSVTLAAATLGIARVPAAPTEVLIAASIVLLSLELSRAQDTPPTLTERRPWWIAAAFGMLHGFGFAGALSQIGLPDREVPAALAWFNLGVEIGQLAFVMAALALAYAMRIATRPWADTARRGAAVAMGLTASAWVGMRLAAI